MPIEDVDYLKQNSIIQSYIFLVDSRDRDRNTYPTPSEYVTTFTMPFTNVIGMQLIDASIPRTMYNIDVYNNNISFYIHSYGNTVPLYSSSNYKTVLIDPGNYTIQTLLPELSKLLTMHIDNNSNRPMANITAKSVSNPPDLKNKIEFRCPYPFAFDMKHSTISETLGFDLFANQYEEYIYKKLELPTYEDNQQIFHSVNITTQNSINQTISETNVSSYCNILYQPYNIENINTINISSNNYVAQRFTVAQKTYLTNIGVAFQDITDYPIPYSIIVGTSNNPSPIENTLISTNFITTNIDGGLSESLIVPPVLLNSNQYYWLIIGSNTINSNSNTNIYYCSNINTYTYDNVLYQSSNSGEYWNCNINGFQTSNQLVTNIEGDMLYSMPVLSEQYNLFTGPRGVLRKLDVSITKYVAQRFTVPSRTFLKGINAAFAFDSGNPVPFSINIGTSTIPYISPEYTLLSSNMNIDFVNGTLSETSITTPLLLLENIYYWVVFGSSNMIGTTSIYYNDINPYIGVHTLYSTRDSGTTWTTPDVAEINYQLSIQVVVADEYNRIEAPGIFNLTGEPYIVMKCPEIEQNSFRSLSFMKTNLGLAKINLGIVGYADKRFDYSSVPARDFHPIGKFSRMTLRFETSKGQLYDFKGVNHTLTFAIRYYEPVQKNRFENSIINPNYDGDFLKYMFHRGDDNAEEDSDDEDEDYSRDNIRNYRVVEAKNTPERLQYNDLEKEWYY